MKIAICGLINSENLGEVFISESLKWLILNVASEIGSVKDISFVDVDIRAAKRLGRGAEDDDLLERRVNSLYRFRKNGIMLERVMLKLKRISKQIRWNWVRNTLHLIRHLIFLYGSNYRKRILKYYNQKMYDVEIIIVDGAGLLEYSRNEYQEFLLLIGQYAQRKNVPLIYNAIGCAGEYNPKDFRCRVMMKALRNQNIYYVSARDNLHTVRQYTGSERDIKLLADAAFWVDQAMNISASSHSNVIGIGLIRGDAVLSYSSGFDEDDFIILFCELAKECERRGYSYRFFTNGNITDEKLAQKVIEKGAFDKSALVERPMDASVLLKTISGFKGLVACRMHSSIAAFTMGIPSVILSWNRKVNQYMEMVGYPERAIDKEQFSADYIMDSLEIALNEGVSQEVQKYMKKLARESVMDYISLIQPSGTISK